MAKFLVNGFCCINLDRENCVCGRADNASKESGKVQRGSGYSNINVKQCFYWLENNQINI